MSAEIRAHLTGLIAHALAAVAPGAAPSSLPAITLERPKQAAHGDFASNVAMQLAKTLKRPPRDVAGAIVAALPASPWLAAAEIAGPGFINLRLHPAAKQAVVPRILAAGSAFGHNDAGAHAPVIVEFVSANPTGPLHVGHGRQAALGDALCSLLEAYGFKVSREFYYNDAGVQIANLATSVQARLKGKKPGDADWPEAAYNGDYIADIAADYRAGKTVGANDKSPEHAAGDPDDLEAIRRFAVAYLRHEQDMDLQAFGVRFDRYYLESSLYSDGRVDATVTGLMAAGKTYENEGALWLRSTEYGDDKDRVMRKSDGSYTYFVPDVAYHVTKWERGFARAINVQGSDHHGTIARVRAGLQALGRGVPSGYPDYVLHKMVTVMKGGEEVKISKRAGSYVTLRDLIDEVGRDAVRFFLVSRKADTEFVFDVDLARSQSEENPVYYVQYAHARIASVLRAVSGTEATPEDAVFADADVALLSSPHALALATKLDDYPDVLAAAAADLAPHQIAFYLRELAAEFHSYYNHERIHGEDAKLTHARAALAAAVRRVLANGLALLGVAAPDRM